MKEQPDSILPGGKNGRDRKVTLALLTTGAIDPNNRAIWSGVAAACRDHDANLICFPGRLVRSPVEFEAQRNVIYNMVDRQTIDGIVLMGGLNAWVSTEETFSFLNQFCPIPIATTGIVLEGIPGVTVDNYYGMHVVVEHLITVHNHRRIAFIRGQANHQEAVDRYQAYLDVLQDHHIPFDPGLVYQGNFKESGGVEGAKALLDERKVHFDALVAASDNMAIGAIKTFQARGLRIPADIAVAGVNDENQGMAITPPLTTAPLHFFEQAYQATLMVFDMLAGKEAPPKLILPTRLLVRESCGCSDPLVIHAQVTPHTERLDSFTDEIRLLDNLIFGDENAQLRLPVQEPFRQLFPELLKAFLDESRGKSLQGFIHLFADILQKTAYISDAFSRWHEIISVLRQFAISQLTDSQSRLRIENLAQQARVVLGETARRHYAYQVTQADEKLHILGEINQSMSVTTSMPELIDVLERSLFLLKIPRCYLYLYDNPSRPDGLARLIFCYEDFHRVTPRPSDMLISTRGVLPGSFLDPRRNHSLTVEPLHFREEQLGYAIFEGNPDEEAIYEILGGQISASLKHTILTERNIRLFEEALEARKVAEQANLLKSRFLSMVSHELRTPLALIVGTIEMMLQEEISGSLPHLPDAYRQDVECIHASSKHLFRLIGDVLDLASNQAGELHLVCEELDLSSVFAEAAVLGKSLAREKNLEWYEEIPANLPLVWGDRTRLRQVTINLLSNAVKFTEQGNVSLAVRVDGAHLLVEISDTGLGIPASEHELIFDEFRRSERSVARGYGGMGLGLAISRRLIELHSGEIGVRSTGIDGRGSTFYFRLPILRNKGFGDNQEKKADDHQNRRRSVLLLLENAADQEHLEKALQDKGFEVEVLAVSEQPDWLNQVIHHPPGAVVLDFQPATESGWELIQSFKQNPETRDIPVIFYSLSAERSRGSMLELDYLAKPVGSEELAQALERLGLREPCTLRNILVVDDDPKVLDMHIRMLENLVKCNILKAQSGKAALEIIHQEDLALILLDLMMPEVDGFEVLRVMRDQESTRNIPVIVLSAQILSTYDMLRLQEGVAAVLGKGLFSKEEVISQVEAALSHSKRLGTQASRGVRQAMAYIHEHYPEPLTRAALAEHVALTERYLTYCFRQELGITPMAYLSRYRVKRARFLLEQGDLNITEVAMAVGFSESSYFNRVFRQEVGVSPGAYRRGQRA
jgi:signal transduction histidine kinase/DNA-binding LacI/PurR family transcriptional regulator/AraC-like DNA-binding protein/response regulator of citrate/malate metabolism